MRRWRPDDASDVGAVARLLADSLVATEREKGVEVASGAALSATYRREVEDPVAALRGATVLVWTAAGDTPVACAVLTAATEGWSELKRVWVEPAHRGAGIAGTMVDEALAIARRRGDRGVRLTVWQWREAAIRLYERSGFAPAARWDPRPGLVCLEREFSTAG